MQQQVWRDLFNRRLCKLESNAINYLNPAHKSGNAWVRIASSVQSREAAHRFSNAPLAETARWKRCVPRFSPINVLIAQWFYLHTIQLCEVCANEMAAAFGAPSLGTALVVISVLQTFGTRNAAGVHFHNIEVDFQSGPERRRPKGSADL